MNENTASRRVCVKLFFCRQEDCWRVWAALFAKGGCEEILPDVSRRYYPISIRLFQNGVPELSRKRRKFRAEPLCRCDRCSRSVSILHLQLGGALRFSNARAQLAVHRITNPSARIMEAMDCWRAIN